MGRSEHLGHRAIVADEVDEECAPQFVTYTFIRQQVSHVEQVTRVLAIQRRHDLSRIEVGEGNNLHFGEAECVFDCRHNTHDYGIVDCAAQDGCDLDLDLNAFGSDDELGDDVVAC